MQATRHRGHLALQYLPTENDAFTFEVRTGWSIIDPLPSVPLSPSPPFQELGATNGDAPEPSI